MKKIGLIGGIGPESTVLYYKGLVYAAQKQIGPEYFPNLVIESLNVYEVLKLCAQKDYASLTEYLMKGIDRLAAAGAELIALTGNTPHIVFNELRTRSSIPLISIVEATSDEASRKGISNAGLLGTIFTMDEDFFKAPFVRQGIKVVTPKDTDRQYINNKITHELERGVVTPATQAEFIRIIKEMKDEEGIDAVILGCTELPLLFNDINLPVSVLDTVQIHIKTLIDNATHA